MCIECENKLLRAELALRKQRLAAATKRIAEMESLQCGQCATNASLREQLAAATDAVARHEAESARRSKLLEVIAEQHRHAQRDADRNLERACAAESREKNMAQKLASAVWFALCAKSDDGDGMDGQSA
jgi:hypothetical protein